MAQLYALGWTPDPNTTTQIVQYRVKNTGTWVSSPGITPANPQSLTANSCTITGLTTNTIYQFQIVSSCCANINTNSSVQESIIFAEVALTHSVNTGVITVDTGVLPFVDNVNYELLNSSSTVIQTLTATGLSSSVSFASVTSGNYTVKYRYTATINGTTVHSDDAGQAGVYYSTGTITV